MDKNLNNGLTKISLGIWLSIVMMISAMVAVAGRPTALITNAPDFFLVTCLAVASAGVCSIFITSGINSVVKYLKG